MYWPDSTAPSSPIDARPGSSYLHRMELIDARDWDREPERDMLVQGICVFFFVTSPTTGASALLDEASRVGILEHTDVTHDARRRGTAARAFVESCKGTISWVSRVELTETGRRVAIAVAHTSELLSILDAHNQTPILSVTFDRIIGELLRRYQAHGPDRGFELARTTRARQSQLRVVGLDRVRQLPRMFDTQEATP